MKAAKAKIGTSPKSKDEIRETILRFLYDTYKTARSLKRSRVKISVIKRNLKQQGLTEQEITSNLDYLIQTDWVIRETESYQLRTKRGIIDTRSEYYKISDKGIDHFEGASRFQKSHPPTGINVTNIQGVTIVGDGNIVNAKYSDLYGNLGLLSEEVMKSDQFTDEQKLNYHAEINTIKSQLSKTSPDKRIIAKAWDKLKPLATVAGIVSFFDRANALIELLRRSL
ncbi:MAG: hypothetical protein OEX77_12160 [Candidatus Bathyarchaeota archaeon]|nr:hypothetical protein [Candidatus Bathyarchaeota archaeon]